MFRDEILISLFISPQRISDSVEKIQLPNLDPTINIKLTQYLEKNYCNPQDYIIKKFQDHDIIFLGEYHRIKHDVELVQKIIPQLYKCGVFNLGIEFACFRDQNKIDSLITAKNYDETLANSIIFNKSIYWGFQEYADIFKFAWKFNQDLPDSVRKFRVIGLNAYTDWSHVKTEEDRWNMEVLEKVFVEGDWDEVMATTILNEFVENNEKALIYSGSHHAITKYKQPIYDEEAKKFIRFNEDRMGNRIYRRIGNRAFTICLHYPFPNEYGWSSERVYPVDGIIDTLMRQINPNYIPIGFDIKGTPFGNLTCNRSMYKHGYVDFLLEDFCDGYIYQKPLSEYESVTPISGFINKHNFAKAKQQIENIQIKSLSKYFGSKALNATFASDANIEYRFRKFK